jgi:hypothetical protein
MAVLLLILGCPLIDPLIDPILGGRLSPSPPPLHAGGWGQPPSRAQIKRVKQFTLGYMRPSSPFSIYCSHGALSPFIAVTVTAAAAAAGDSRRDALS